MAEDGAMPSPNRRQALVPGLSIPDIQHVRNNIEVLRDRLSKKFPNAVIRFDPPTQLPVPWFLEIGTTNMYQWVHVSWSEGSGFSISDCTDPNSNLSMPDRRCLSVGSAFQKVVEILSHRK